MRGIYKNSCISCGKEISDDRGLLGTVCYACLKKLPVIKQGDKEIVDEKLLTEILRKQKKEGTELKKLLDLIEEVEEINRMFKEVYNSDLWSVQKVWIRRVLQGRSFTAIAPTGIGKTTFGIITSVYLAGKGKRSLIIVPTITLVNQVIERLRLILDKGVFPGNIVIAYYHSDLKAKEKREMLERLKTGGFNIGVISASFIAKNFDTFPSYFDFVFVDDVDAILKSSKNIDKILQLLGFSQNTIELATEKLKLGVKMGFYLKNPEKYQQEIERYREISEKLEKQKTEAKGILVVSTATGKPRGIKHRLFRELLDFEIGSRSDTLRNILNFYKVVKEEEMLESALEVINKLKASGGGLVFIPVDKGIEYAKEVEKFFNEKGIKAVSLVSNNGKKNFSREEILRKFQDGEIDVIIGVSIYYGIIVRGLDIPERISYALFLGSPRFKIPLSIELLSSSQTVKLLQVLVEKLELEETEKRRMERVIKVLRQRPNYEKMLEEGKEILAKYINDPKIRDILKTSEDIAVVEEGDKTYLLIPDVATYIQASGRTSRLYVGGLTLGVSVVLEDNPAVLKGLMSRYRWVDEGEWKEWGVENIETVVEKLKEDREKVKRAREGSLNIAEKMDLHNKTVLIVVESPTKAQTIARLFGKPTVRKMENLNLYEVSVAVDNTSLNIIVTSSQGHIYDVVPSVSQETKTRISQWGEVIEDEYYGILRFSNGEVKEGVNVKFVPVYASIKRCRKCGYQVASEQKLEECPMCGSKDIIDKEEFIRDIAEIVKEVDEIYIATDPDAEGEKIGWDLATFLTSRLPYTTTKKLFVKRMEFHEVTKRGIENALKPQNLRDFNVQRVEAQIVRRVEDRWIGFELSQKVSQYMQELYQKNKKDFLANSEGYIWKRIKSEGGIFSFLKRLSAGRVQTPVLGWIINRYDEAQKEKKENLIITLEGEIKVEVEKNIVGEISLQDLVKVEVIEEGERDINPLPPFTTDTLLSEISSMFRIGVAEVMSIAQTLFEAGLITYHRTDSTHVSDYGKNIAKEFLQSFANRKGLDLSLIFYPRSWGEEGTHECIRPTRPVRSEELKDMARDGLITLPAEISSRHFKVYDRIFDRFIASQMPPAKAKYRKYKLKIGKGELEMEKLIELVVPSWMEIYKGIQKIEENWKELKEGYVKILSIDSVVRTPKLYTQADIIKLMKEKEIGRPSTYSRIIETLLKRKYVVETKNGFLVPTSIGRKVYEYLTSVEAFAKLVSEERTRELLQKMDKVESGEENYIALLERLYQEMILIKG